MLVSGSISLGIMDDMVDILVGRGSVPSGGTGVVIDVVSSAKMIDATLPTRRKRSVLVDIWIEVSLLVVGRYDRWNWSLLTNHWCGLTTS